jgi:alcohol dehydrogenase
MRIPAFDFARIPPIHFGAGKLQRLAGLVAALGGRSVLLVTGGRSLEASGALASIRELLGGAGLEFHSVVCEGEPGAALIDDVCAEYRERDIDVVIGIGGGSVVDAGKAVSAMLPHDNSIFDHLEGVGRGVPHSGVKKPFIAIPTTSGTGSEVTKNAVISQVGARGYKKSLRHDNLIPDAVVVDGELLVSCPRQVSAACGMDAFTQLLEPFLSPACSPMTEALAWSGFEALKDNLLAVCGDGAGDVRAREAMAYASLLSGITLANDGLGILHGLASPIGGYHPIPHGVVCATLVASSVRANVKALRARDPQGPGVARLARVGKLFLGEPGLSAQDYCDALVDELDDWTHRLEVPRLGDYGFGEKDLDRVLDDAANRNNPVLLTREEIRALVAERL